jgi:hypothetical protein
MTRLDGRRQKYNAKCTYSQLCGRTFHSKAEAIRGEELCLLEKAGEIRHLQYQHKLVLSSKPRITITIDFRYVEQNDNLLHYWTYEDVKGVLTRDFRTKLAWLKEKHAIEVKLIR